VGICTWVCDPGSATCPDAPLPTRSRYPVAEFKIQFARICVELAEPVIKQAAIKLQEDKAFEGAGGGAKLKIVPYTVRRLSFGDLQEDNVAGLYDGPFPWENTFGFRLAGMVGISSDPMR
jgi:hypothetical protein